MRRLIPLTSALVVSLVLVATPVSADTSTLSAGAWFGAESTGGAGFVSQSFCRAGSTFTSPPLTHHLYRCSLEFDISGIPAGATITSARLSLRANGIDLFCAQTDCSVDLDGYVGNGTGELADLTAGSFLFTMPYTGTNFAYVGHDVTTFVTSLYTNGDDWAGFTLRRDPLGYTPYDSPADGQPPILEIQYTLPAASVAASLNDAAMAPASAASAQPLAVLGMALALIGSLGALAVIQVRTRR
jgi:hypothetical protein